MTTGLPQVEFPAASIRARSLIAALALAGTAALSTAIFVVPHARLVLLAAVVPAVAIAVASSRIRRGWFDYFEVVFPFSLLYFLYFGVGAVYLSLRPRSLPSIYLLPYLEAALGVAVLGYLAFVAGYAGFLNRVKPSATRQLTPRGAWAVWLPGLLGFAGAMAAVVQERMVQARSAISAPLSALQQFMPIFLFAWALAWCLVFRRGERHAHRWFVALGLLPMAAVIAFLTIGGKSLVLTIAGLPALAFWYARGKLPLKTIVAILLVAVFVVFPFYNAFRNQNRKATVSDRVEGTIHMAGEWSQRDYLERSMFAFLSRMAVVSSVAAIVRETGRWVEYRYGETLFLAPMGLLIPRFLWPDKPNISIGREFGVTFNLVNPLDKETKIAPTVVGEFYWNFHLPGVLVGMFLLGLAYKWFFKRYGEAPDEGPIRTAIYITLLATSLHFEGNFAMLVGGFVKTLVIMLLIVAVMRQLGLVDAQAPSQPPRTA